MAMTFQPVERSPFASITYLAESVTNLAESLCIGTRIIRDTTETSGMIISQGLKLIQTQMDHQFAELEAQSKLLP